MDHPARHRQLASARPSRRRACSLVRARKQDDVERAVQREMEDELRDSSNFVDFLAPRPLRLTFFLFSAGSCAIALLSSVARLLQAISSEFAAGQQVGGFFDDPLINVLVNALGFALFLGLWRADSAAGQQRVETRKRIRSAQIKAGDREVFVNEQGERMSRLKEVNDEWILRRLERWGRQDGMPFLGPKKGAIVAQLVAEKQPRVVVEVGTMAGYSALVMAQQLPPGGKVITIEKDLSWFLAAKRFMWQASQGEKNKQAQERVGDKVDVRLGEAVDLLSKWSVEREGQIELLFLDGTPKETLGYLKAAEAHLAPGALVIADNAVVFAQGGMKPYNEYVRSDPKYSSRLIECSLEWQDNVPDGLEVSTWLGAGAQQQRGGASQAITAGTN